MKLPGDFRFWAAVTVAAIAVSVVVVPVRVQKSAHAAQSIACAAPASLTHFIRPLSRTARKLATGQPLTIVAVGSSSTAGAGASSTAANYPNRLAAELRERFPLRTISVVNHGVNGIEVREMLEKFDEALPKDNPDLVLWQLGTNSLLRDRALTGQGDRISLGLSKIRAIRADVILVNPQYAPKVIAKPEAEHMLKIIAGAAEQGNVNLFDRYAVMRNWRMTQNIPFSAFLSSDELHMNDWSYGCIAKLLGQAIAEAASRPALTATAAPAARAR
jgi:lysophospholipase L1-like esterase